MKIIVALVLTAGLLIMSPFSLPVDAIGENINDNNAFQPNGPELSLRGDASDRVLGDINADGNVDVNDSIALFRYTMLPDSYPIDYPGSLDMDKNKIIDISDAIQLFRYSMVPDMFPIDWGEDIPDVLETDAPETDAPVVGGGTILPDDEF